MIGRKFKLLLVEDNKSEADTLIRLLNQASHPHPFTIRVANTLKDGLAISQEMKADLTLLDLQLPDVKDWHETARAIKNFFPPVIVVTSMPPNEVELECYAYGAEAVYDKHEVLKVVELLLSSITRTILRTIAPKVFFNE